MNPKFVFNRFFPQTVDTPEIYVKSSDIPGNPLYMDSFNYAMAQETLLGLAQSYVSNRGINPEHAGIRGHHLLVVDTPENREIIGKAWSLDHDQWLRINLSTVFGRNWRMVDTPDWTPLMHVYLDLAQACFMMKGHLYARFTAGTMNPNIRRFADRITPGEYWSMVMEDRHIGAGKAIV